MIFFCPWPSAWDASRWLLSILRSLPVAASSADDAAIGTGKVDVPNARIRAGLKPGPHDDFLPEQSAKDAVAGLVTEPLRWS